MQLRWERPATSTSPVPGAAMRLRIWPLAVTAVVAVAVVAAVDMPRWDTAVVADMLASVR